MTNKPEENKGIDITNRIDVQSHSGPENPSVEADLPHCGVAGNAPSGPAPSADSAGPQSRGKSAPNCNTSAKYSSKCSSSGSAPAAKEASQRRVGSMTLGVCLIAAGVFFLLYYFVPAFPWQLALKAAPSIGLVLLGCEVLFFAVRPGRWKYDFLSVFACLLMMAGCFCLSLLPLFWAEIDPARSQQMDQLCEGWEGEVYTVLSEELPDLRIRTLDGYLDLDYGAQLPETVRDAVAINRSFLRVELRGPYNNASDFAASCRRLTDALQAHDLCPEQLRLLYDDPEGTGWSFELCLEGVVEQGWTAAEMAAETHQTNYREELDEGTGPDLEVENALEAVVTA